LHARRRRQRVDPGDGVRIAINQVAVFGNIVDDLDTGRKQFLPPWAEK